LKVSRFVTAILLLLGISSNWYDDLADLGFGFRRGRVASRIHVLGLLFDPGAVLRGGLGKGPGFMI
jgi:hypothetical protein